MESSGANPPYNDALETMTIALTEVDLDDDEDDTAQAMARD